MGFDSPFTTVAEDILEAEAIRKANAANVLPFGVAYLDDALRGIARSDLVLLGGRSGGGKTELATHIAATNALAGRRVYYFALEAEKHEIGMRVLYKALARAHFRNAFRQPGKISYDRWLMNDCEEQLAHYYREEKVAGLALDRFHVRYSSSTYGLQDFEADIGHAGDADLIVLDHLHYLDLDRDETNQAYKAAVKRIRNLALEQNIPVVLVAHIRKGDRHRPTLCPEQEDFHGSSDIVKICTKAITIASAADYVTPTGEHYPTFMRAAKYRRNGSVERFIGLTKYNFRQNRYDEQYTVGHQRSDKNGVYFNPVDFDKVPDWASGHVGI